MFILKLTSNRYGLTKSNKDYLFLLGIKKNEKSLLLKVSNFHNNDIVIQVEFIMAKKGVWEYRRFWRFVLVINKLRVIFWIIR
ncbi:hypothetical protein SAMN05421593_4542 [Chryseobacterium culicis]|uniref:Uncharacterized protein n=1 Tax=Chryseobacterium culicis TaxID=680127 RepID=A0A1H6INQ0_CHRCI|nr:hypothetical protein SAMN05421593_4542 [Chryseobacterium culicis]